MKNIIKKLLKRRDTIWVKPYFEDCL